MRCPVALRLSALAAVVAMAPGCDSASNGPFAPPPALASITVSAVSTTLQVTTRRQYTAQGFDATGKPVAFTPAWDILSGGGSVTSSGVVTAGTLPAVYVNTVRASSGNVAGFASLTVTPGPLATIAVTPNPSAPQVNSTLQLVATGLDSYGNAVAITPAWSVVAGGGTISGTTGLFVAGSLPGLFANTVKAADGGVSGFATIGVVAGSLATITISPSPGTFATGASQQFTAVGRDASNNIVPLSPNWTVLNATAGAITPTGVFTAGSTVGTYTNVIRAASGITSATATVIVTAVPAALASISITPNPATVAGGGTQQFTAFGQDAAGVVIAIVPAPVWTVVNGGGTIAAGSGLFTAGSVAGAFTNTIRATSGTVSGFATAMVTTAASVGPSFGRADPFAVLGSTVVSCTGTSSIGGDVGVASVPPLPAGAITGFPAPCSIVAPGDVTPHVNDALATVAQLDVTPAYLALAAMPCATALTGQDLGGMTLAPGVYCFTSSAQLTGNLTLAGPANGLWVFQIASALTTGTSAQVILSGGAQAKNVFWQVGTSATLGQTTVFRGNIVAAVSITMVQGSTLVGRALSKAGVTMDGSTITLP